MTKTIKTISAFALVATLSIVAFAAIVVDDDGVGFVGKGDVQLAFGWSNAQLQANAAGVDFTLKSDSVVVTEASWECTNSSNQKIQERERTTTTSSSISALLDGVARTRNQITGFNLNGFDGTPTTTSSSTTEGNTLNSCPSGPWTLTTSAGAPVEVSNTSVRTLTISAPGQTDKVIELEN